MRDQNIQPAYILSASHAEDTRKENDRATFGLHLGLTRHKIPFKWVKGFYQGFNEDSFLCVPRGPSDVIEIWKLAKINNQESVLHLDQDRNATLAFLNGGENLPLGKFRPCSALRAAECDAWTFDPETNTFFICE